MTLLAGVGFSKVYGQEAKDDTTILRSPDQELKASFWLKTDRGIKSIHYQVFYKDRPVILDSETGIEMDNHLGQLALALTLDETKGWMDDLELKHVGHAARDTVWKPLYGERNRVRDRYNQVTLQFEKASNPDYQVHLIARAYNEGLAFRYYFPETPSGIYYHITGEKTEFTFPEHTRAWYEQWAQGPYSLQPLRDWPDESERPLTLELPGGLYTCLTEAEVVDYVRTKFALSEHKPNTVITSLYESVDKITYFHTPWRVIMVGEEPGELIENNDLILNLNHPNRIADPGWIRPGKIVRDVSLTNEGARAWIDFAAEHNLQYLLFDWKWYGPSFTFGSDAGTVDIDLDLPGIIEYGRQKGIGIWLYVNQQALLRQDHEIFPLYKKWGVKGVKYGFVQVGSHRWTNWLHESVQRAAENGLMVNIHDEFRTTGEQRTWPNILTVEGIRGNEEMPDATHNTILPFTRGVAGMGDYTICYYDDRIKTTHAHQLALGVIMFSPLQTLFWYDQASDYRGEQEIEFFEKLPTVWDNTRVLAGEIGEYVSIARRQGDKWFVGTITNNEARELELRLDFLEPGKKYRARLYGDDPGLGTRTNVAIEEQEVDASTVLEIKLVPSGGQAIIIENVE